VSCFSASFDGIACHPGGPPGHPAGWNLPDSHGASAKAKPDTSAIQGFLVCEKCHGTNFAGGILGESCFTCHGVPAPHSPSPWRVGTRTHTNTNVDNAPVCAQCHANGANFSRQPNPPAPAGTPPACFNNTLCHGSVVLPHPFPFTDPALHGPAAKADLTFCEGCHADPSDGGPGSNPRFNVRIGRLVKGCEDCHEPGTAHPVPWSASNAPVTSHQTAGNMANVCVLCHGANLQGGAGPACSDCHTAGSPLTATNCTSCHGNPPAGSVSPNVAGKHAEHNALDNVTGVCATCHNGAGSGTSLHNNRVDDVLVLPTYDAKSGAAVYNSASKTCSQVSCHGGQATPSWSTGTLDVNTQCTSCHQSGTTQYNGYFSGKHTKHIDDVKLSCPICHSTTKLQATHFTTLNTTAMEGPASGTLNDALQYNGVSCNPSAGGLVGCHGQRNWQ
jgi:predicted CxxxxCH...CXXCH cytochrome family protein